MKSIRLIVVDDHPIVRTGLQTLLISQTDFELVGEAANGAEAITLVEEVHPHVVLMDLRMTTMDGIEATTAIKKAHPEVSVLMLTSYEGHKDILRALEAGATGYLLKDAVAEQLFSAIRAVAQGQSIFAPKVNTQLFSQLSTPTEETLSMREVEVLQLVAQGASNKEVARYLHLSEATVKSHLIRIFNKLDVTDRTAAVTVAMERGILTLQK
jgi:DNA-binding NarL/FixJ family response regulator